ncbi:TPA: hypothetical protein JBF89_13170 [Legionella pneumophila]|nr:hypothetical protein [Legionella pneumophila]HAU0349915.1 hypothetical protein [Legionella pneumophila]HAU0353406.1 hypothetical protein [Legionella pneumophila]HAU0359495.1 hypothetical protein [Legionella pneumophila]HAU0368052.1 hypothetical protein [Legionella pneumophila]
MAIKKNAFELYTKERVLPQKKDSIPLKSHFFDDIITDDNDDSMVHKRSTIINENKEKNGPQTESKWSTNGPQHEIYYSDFDQDKALKEKVGQYLGSNSNGPQTVHELKNKKNASSIRYRFEDLVGNQRKLVVTIYRNMKMNDQKQTEELTLESIANFSGINISSVKNTLYRLTQSKILTRVDQKNGRGGWVKYSLSEDMIAQIDEQSAIFSLRHK